MKKILKALLRILDFPISVYVNFRTLPINQAIHMPILIGYKCQLKGLKKNSIVIEGPINMNMIKIGIMRGTQVACQKKRTILSFGNGSKMFFCGSGDIAKGTSVIIKDEGSIIFGEGFSCNTSCSFIVYKKIEFGKDCVLGWNVSLYDGDGHYLMDRNKQVINYAKKISIGDHVWLCSNVTVLKGVKIVKNSVVACNSILTKSLSDEEAIYGGNPVRKLKDSVWWVRDGRGYK